MMDLASMHNSITTVAFYDTLGPTAVEFVIHQTELTTVACAEMYVAKLLDLKKKGKAESMKNIVSFDPLKLEDAQLAKDLGVRLITLAELIKAGQENNKTPFNEPTPDSIYMFCYTSGTTGDSKAAMLTHKNLMSTVAATNACQINIDENDTLISYLPLAHSFEKAVFVASISEGSSIGYYSGDPLKLMEDLQALRPTVFPSVPRLFNRIYDKIVDGVKSKSGTKQWLFTKAISSKLYYLQSSAAYTHRMWDRLVFNQMKQLLGGNVRLMVTGSAPIAGDVLNYLKVCFCCPIYEGYGQTETAGAATITRGEDPATGHVGGPLPSIKIRLRDIPEMEYFHTDPNPRGEICFKGNSVFPGYFKSPEKNKEAFDPEGWLRSGDVGMVFPNGSIKIIDRAKNIFKLSQGEYIAPEKLENVYVQSPYVAQIFVYGDSLQHFLISIIVADPVHVKRWATENHLDTTELKVYMTDPKFKKVVMDDLNRLATENKFSGLERIKNTMLTLDQFTIDNDLLTPTMKIKRNVAKKVYEKEIHQLYDEMPKEVAK